MIRKIILDKCNILSDILGKLYNNVLVGGDMNINVLAQTNVFKQFKFTLDEYL